MKASQSPGKLGLLAGCLVVACVMLAEWRHDINWGSAPDYAGFLLALAALLGVSSWRRQLQGTHEFELARRVLRALLEMREGVRFVRHPMMHPAEAGDGEVEGRRWEELAYENRWRRVSEAETDLSAAMIEVEIVWADESFSSEIRELRQHINRVALATRRFLRDLQRPSSSRTPSMTQEDEDVLYGLNDDEFDRELQRLVKAVEEKVRPHLRR